MSFHLAVCGLCAVLLSAAACKEAPTQEQRLSDEAHLVTRQLIAGLNARNEKVLSQLLVVTSTQGGPPRSLTTTELKKLTYPEGPYAQLGPGKPGTMLVRDGKGTKRELIIAVVPKVGPRVVARRTTLSQYLKSENPQANKAIAAGIDMPIVTVAHPSR